MPIQEQEQEEEGKSFEKWKVNVVRNLSQASLCLAFGVI